MTRLDSTANIFHKIVNFWNIVWKHLDIDQKLAYFLEQVFKTSRIQVLFKTTYRSVYI